MGAVNTHLLEEFISGLVKSRLNHAKFVNTLSMLEYIGARKIIKSQNESSISLEILSHAAEEIRHAFALKKVALKMSEGILDSYSEENLLCGNEARRYIQNIDFGVARVLSKDVAPTQATVETNYLLTTLLLEERANQLYPYYERFLAEAGFPGILNAICREEDSHLKSVTEGLSSQKDLSQEQLSDLRALEEREFTHFIESLSQKIFC